MEEPQKDQKPQGSIIPFFEPSSVAIIGSLGGFGFGGQVLARHLIDFRFPGKFYLVNPSRDSIAGMKVYPSIREIPEAIDLAVVMTPSQVVPSIIKQCTERGVKAAIIISDGFAERDEEGARLQREIVRIAKQTGLRLLGPNTIGTANSTIGLASSPYEIAYEKMTGGSIALCGQTGFIGPQALPLNDMRIGKLCDFGNKCDVNESDLLEYLGDDPEIKVIAMHLEDIKDGRRFLDKAVEVIPKKPLLILKPGRTKESAKALASHTGSLAGEDQIYDNAFKQVGIIRVNTFGELFDFAKVLALQPLPKGNRLAIITFSGGVGVVGLDAAVESGLTPAELSLETAERLNRIFPSLAGNPVDIGPIMPAMDKFVSCFPEIMEVILNDENVDCAVISSFAMPDSFSLEMFSQILARLKESTSKPITLWLHSIMGTQALTECIRRYEDMGIPVCSEWETAAKALGVAFRYSKIRSRYLLGKEEP